MSGWSKERQAMILKYHFEGRTKKMEYKANDRGQICLNMMCKHCRMNAEHPVRARGCDGACEVTVIQTVTLRGAGTQNDLCHLVREYWTKDGKKIGEEIVS